MKERKKNSLTVLVHAQQISTDTDTVHLTDLHTVIGIASVQMGRNQVNQKIE